MTGPRRFSQAISEGEGISLVARVDSADGARAAEQAGADAIVVGPLRTDIPEQTVLPVLWRGATDDAVASAVADAVVVAVGDGDEDGERLEAFQARAAAAGVELVVEVADEEQLELALEWLDPEIVLLAPAPADDDDPLGAVLDLLPDVPAGKLAIAAVAPLSRDEVLALERAGIDAVLVEGEELAALAGGEHATV